MFTKASLSVIRRDLDNALKDVADKHSISINIGSIRYDTTSFTTRLTAAAVATDGTVETPGRTALQRHFPEYLDKEINLSNGLTGTIIEYHSRKRKYPFIVMGANDKRYKVNEATVVREMAK